MIQTDRQSKGEAKGQICIYTALFHIIVNEMLFKNNILLQCICITIALFYSHCPLLDSISKFHGKMKTAIVVGVVVQWKNFFKEEGWERSSRRCRGEGNRGSRHTQGRDLLTGQVDPLVRSSPFLFSKRLKSLGIRTWWAFCNKNMCVVRVSGRCSGLKKQNFVLWLNKRATWQSC